MNWNNDEINWSSKMKNIRAYYRKKYPYTFAASSTVVSGSQPWFSLFTFHLFSSACLALVHSISIFFVVVFLLFLLKCCECLQNGDEMLWMEMNRDGMLWVETECCAWDGDDVKFWVQVMQSTEILQYPQSFFFLIVNIHRYCRMWKRFYVLHDTVLQTIKHMERV